MRGVRLSIMAVAMAALASIIAPTWSGNSAVAAQDCPPGTQWAARPYQVTGPNGQPVMQQNFGCYAPPPPPPPPFRKYFGAVAFDEQGQKWYLTNLQLSESDAKSGVVGYCREKGGARCKLMLSYTNQCAAVARAGGVPGQDSVNTGSSLKEAEANAIRVCGSDWGAGQCRIHKSGCSLHGREGQDREE